mgnify:CR=1 FL=1
MLMISKEAIESVIATKEKLANSEKKAECIADTENVIRTKQSHLLRAEWGSCCGDICGLVPQLETEIGILQEALDAMKGNDSRKAAGLLQDYLAFLEKNYEAEHPNRW